MITGIRILRPTGGPKLMLPGGAGEGRVIEAAGRRMGTEAARAGGMEAVASVKAICPVARPR
jgi:hypothetical protein